jgi:hypothetical protein
MNQQSYVGDISRYLEIKLNELQRGIVHREKVSAEIRAEEEILIQLMMAVKREYE